jgi:geranylgeranyl reductase family protein
MTAGEQRLDVLVVGGGPAGSTVAWQLARAGRRVAVVDAATFPRVKLCAGWVTREVLADLELDPAAYPHTIQPFSAVTVALDEAEHETRWDHVAGWGIVRAEFDTHLLRRAAAAGAEVREGVRARAVREVTDGVEVDTDGGPIRAAFVVGAGGHGCPVARALGAPPSDEDVVVTQESETRVGAERLRTLTPRPGTPELIAEPDFRGYGWYFTKGDFLNVGVGALGGTPIRRRLERMVARLRASGRLPADVLLTPFKGHAYAIRRDRARRPSGARFVLVGDAAGLARDVSGEGIGPAVRSARIAADVLLEARPDAYPARLDAALGRRAAAAFRLARLIPDRLLRAAARQACMRPGLRRRLVLEGAFGMGVTA